LAYSLKSIEKLQQRKSGRKDFGLMTGRKKRVHFFGKGYCEKCAGKKK
jgi:hypothetical protein